MPARKRIKNLYELVMDFLKKCSDDHVGAFGAMSAFFILLSIFPFMIFLLTLTRYIPFSKDDIIVILTRMISFEEGSLIKSIVNEIYRKTGTTVSAISIIAALWSSSRGVYSIVIGLNSVYDIDENRNYFAIRLFSLVYTLLFALMISVMLVMWVFGNSLYSYFLQKFPFVVPILGYFMHKRIIFSLIFLTLLFMIIYKWIPNRVSSFRKQFPEARDAMDRFKMEVANELGVNLKQGYNGDITARDAGSIGGEMVRKMIKRQEEEMAGQSR